MINRPTLSSSLRRRASAPLSAKAESAVTIPPPAADASAQSTGLETAVLAGGCFWGIQAVYQHVKGVTNAVSGYAGGAQKDAVVRDRQLGPHQPRRKRARDVRPARDFLRQDPADLFRGRARPDAAQPPGPGHRPAISLGDFPAERSAGEDRAGLHRAARHGQSLQAPDRDQNPDDEGCRSTRPRPITRITRPSIPTSPTSPSTTHRRSRT